MSELNKKFQQLTGINGFDIDQFIESCEDKTQAYNKLQWKISKGLCRDKSLFHEEEEESKLHKDLTLYAEVMTGIAEACGIDKDSVKTLDINGNETSEDTADKKAQDILSEAYAILGYDMEEDDNTSSN